MLDRLKNILGGSSSSRRADQGSRSGAPGNGAAFGEPFTRPSNGLDQFFSSLVDRSGLSILDFAGASQANISFITSMGHRLASEDFVKSIELTFGTQDASEAQADPVKIDQFISENLGFPEGTFDGALVWDALQFLSPHLLQITVDRLYETLRPNAYLLAFFYADERTKNIPLYSYRITDQKTLTLAPRGMRAPVQFFNNRALEKLFHRFQSVKFFLARDSLREIIVKR